MNKPLNIEKPGQIKIDILTSFFFSIKVRYKAAPNFVFLPGSKGLRRVVKRG